MGEDLERAGGGKESGESNTSEGLVKSKVVEDILDTVNRENLGFSEQQLRPALDALIDTYGTDDAYKWITKDNFAVLVNYIFEFPRMTSGGSSSPLCSGKYAHRRHHNDQIPHKHYGNATESGLLADQGHFHSTPLRSNDSLKKHSRGEYSSSDSTKAKKMKFYSNCPGSRSTEHIKKSPLEQTGPVSPAAARGETDVSSRRNKLHLDTFPSAPSSGRKEHCMPKQATQAGKQRGSVGPFNGNTNTDTGTSNASFKKNDGVDFKSSVVPRVKERESSIHRSIHEEYASGKQVHPNHMCEKQLSATNTACVDEVHTLGSPKARNYYDRKIRELEMDTKECRKGKVRYYNEPQKDYKRNFSSKQISLTEELNMTSKGHCMKKVKDHNEFVPSVTERVSVKQKSGNSEGDSVERAIPTKHIEQNNSINKKFYEENESWSRDIRKPSNDKESMPSKEFTSLLKKQHSGKFEDPNREVLLPCRKTNNVVQYHCLDKPNKKNAVVPEMLPLEETRDIQDHLTVQDSFHGPKELTEEKKKPGLSKKKALSISNNNKKDNCLHGQGTPRSGT